MRDLLELILCGHRHKWAVIEKIPLRVNGFWEGDLYTLQCEKCGRLKKKRIRP